MDWTKLVVSIKLLISGLKHSYRKIISSKKHCKKATM